MAGLKLEKFLYISGCNEKSVFLDIVFFTF